MLRVRSRAPYSLPPPLAGWTSALTLDAFTLSSSVAGFPPPSLSLPPGFALAAFARAPPRFPSPLWAPLRSAHATQARVRTIMPRLLMYRAAIAPRTFPLRYH